MGDIEPPMPNRTSLGSQRRTRNTNPVTKVFIQNSDYSYLQKVTKYEYGNMVNTDERHYTRNLNYLVVPVHIGYKKINPVNRFHFFCQCRSICGVALHGGKEKSYRNGKKFHTESDILAVNMGIKRFDWGCRIQCWCRYAKTFSTLIWG